MTRPTRIAVVGTTSWGTTLAVLLARNSHDVVICARGEAEAYALATGRENVRHRPGLAFPALLRVTAGASEITAADLVVLAVPSASLAANLARIGAAIAPDATVLSVIKGIDPTTGRRPSEVITDAGIDAARVCVLSGPNFAAEIARGLPAASVVAGSDATRVQAVQSLLNGPLFRVYSSDDVSGVELGGALKNVVAIACGLSDGLGYGENAKAALITRALAEITRLGVALGARPLTFLGLAGIGDLVLTCESDLSRNRRFGLALAAGQPFEAAIAALEGVVEGAVTARAVPILARNAGVELPICDALRAVLYEAKAPAEAVRELMARAAKPEFAAWPQV